MRPLLFLTALVLTACATAAEPERYAGLTCEELSDMQRSYSAGAQNYDLYGDRDINEMGRTNARNNTGKPIGESREGLRPYEKAQEKDRNSIRAAARLKGCEG